MAKDRERRIAYDMYVSMGKTAKDIAHTTGVSEKTIGKWVQQHGWKEERDARANSSVKGLVTIKRVISNIAEQRIEIEELRRKALEAGNQSLIYQLDKEAASLADQVSKYNKAMMNMDKENRISPAIYLEVMDDIFSSLRAQDEKLYSLTLDFQESHSQFICKKLG